MPTGRAGQGGEGTLRGKVRFRQTGAQRKPRKPSQKKTAGKAATSTTAKVGQPSRAGAAQKTAMKRSTAMVTNRREIGVEFTVGVHAVPIVYS